jgi:hypothetical protein
MKNLTKKEMYRQIKIDEKKMTDALISIGNKYCHSESKDKWTSKNPTCGYCYKISEVISFQLKKLNIQHSTCQIKIKNSNHWFIMIENKIIDVTNNKNMQYQKAVRRSFFPCNTRTHMSLGAEAIAQYLNII